MSLHPNPSTSRPQSLSQQVLMHNLSDRLHAADFNTPAKIIQQQKRYPGYHQFQSVTPDVSIPGTPAFHDHYDDYELSNDESYTPVGAVTPQQQQEQQRQQRQQQRKKPLNLDTPTSLSPHRSGEKEGDEEKESVHCPKKEQPTTAPKAAAATPRHTSSVGTLTNVSTIHHASSPQIIISSSSPSTPTSLSRPGSPGPHHPTADDDDIRTVSSIGHDPSPSASTSTSIPSRPSTPSQFMFRKPEYNTKYKQTHFHHPEKKDTIFHGLKRFFKHDQQKHKHKEREHKLQTMSGSVTDLSFANEFNKDIEGRYGKWGRFVGKGAGGSVRVIRRSTDDKTFAVKQFRKRAPGENEKEYVKKVTAEFCIGSTLHHPNVIETLDLIQEKTSFYEIMEYAPNDLFNIVMSGKMTREEVACCWRQMLSGVQYLHSMGIAHRDLKLDNMMIDERGIVKLIDFGCAVVYKYPYESKIHKCKGVCGSDPYIAPEQYTHPDYDPAAADLWSCAIVFICMIIRRFPWRTPRPSQDQSYKNFITPSSQGATRLFKLLPRDSRDIVSHMLATDASKRVSLEDILADPWVAGIPLCTPQSPHTDHMHHLLIRPTNPEVLERGNIIILDLETPNVSGEEDFPTNRKGRQKKKY